ncbi:hypothetical protein GGTG_08433 [Gaeumannomyces tritici R3-111a-1]|uniref:Uncharacterized protein n=1 Tax=Gaeumannomyces tritici (strain R3-111a-1) TaxID=644352 RepID=J3P4J6_GAET3|nr:hypothetical protein GGTG_08433 [Gaeumannomyces tritici R3-111a-1]EJT74593.1 hypothetical protein GGTG_08433 [Gaeumannomyces tritici R3-111a-1]
MRFSTALVFCAGLVSVSAQAAQGATARSEIATSDSYLSSYLGRRQNQRAAEAANGKAKEGEKAQNKAGAEKAKEGKGNNAAEGEEEAAEGENNNAAEGENNNANQGQIEEGNANNGTNNANNGTENAGNDRNNNNGNNNQNNGQNNNNNNNNNGAGVNLGQGLSQEDLARLLAGNNNLGGIDLNNRDSILAGIGRLMNGLCVGNIFNVNRNQLFALNSNQQLQLLFQLQQIQQLQQLGFVNGAQVQNLFNVGFNNNNILALGGIGGIGGVPGINGFNFAGFKRAVAEQMKNLKRTELRRGVHAKRQQCKQAQQQRQQSGDRRQKA